MKSLKRALDVIGRKIFDLPGKKNALAAEEEIFIRAHFDRDFYISTYPEILSSGLDPVKHFIKVGWLEGRNPNKNFDTRFYLQCYSDVKLSGINPFYHFLKWGNKEGRMAVDTGQISNATPKSVKKKQVKPVHQPFWSLVQQNFAASPSVYTCIIGDRHLLKDNTTFAQEKIVFSDREHEIQGWDFRPALAWDPNPKMSVLFHKYCIGNFTKSGQRLIWIDSRISVQEHVLKKINEYLDDSDVCFFRHFERDCVFDEIDAVIAGKRASISECDDFRRYLEAACFPKHSGLYETGIVGIKVNNSVNRYFSQLFALCHRFVARDQLMLPLVLHDNILKISVFNEGATHLRNTPGVFVHSWQR